MTSPSLVLEWNVIFVWNGYQGQTYWEGSTFTPERAFDVSDTLQTQLPLLCSGLPSFRNAVSSLACTFHREIGFVLCLLTNFD